MSNWLYDPSVTFEMWSVPHLITIGIIAAILFGIYTFKSSLIPYRKNIRITIGVCLLLSRISLDIWYVSTGVWSVEHALPLELCSIASLACGVMLLTKSRFLFKIFYFIAIGGALQAVLTPALDFGFPQYRYVQFFADHTMLMLAPLLLIWLYDFTITLKSVWKSFFALNIIAACIFFVNQMINANYMFLLHKPSTPSILDVLGPYPFYLLILEGIALGIFILLYLPFRKRTRTQS